VAGVPPPPPPPPPPTSWPKYGAWRSWLFSFLSLLPGTKNGPPELVTTSPLFSLVFFFPLILSCGGPPPLQKPSPLPGQSFPPPLFCRTGPNSPYNPFPPLMVRRPFFRRVRPPFFPFFPSPPLCRTGALSFSLLGRATSHCAECFSPPLFFSASFKPWVGVCEQVEEVVSYFPSPLEIVFPLVWSTSSATLFPPPPPTPLCLCRPHTI